MIYIYIIENLINHKIYLGSTKDPKKREHRHFYELDAGTHHNIYLQRSYNKYKENNFKFLILDTLVEEEYQFELEEWWATLLEPEYNIGSFGGGDNLSKHPNKEEIIQRRSQTLKEKNSKLSQEERQLRFARYGDSNYNWKGGVSFRTKTCLKCESLLALNNANGEYCNSCRDRTGSNNPFYGKEHTKEALEKMSKASKNFQDNIKKGRIGPPSHYKKVKVNGTIYHSMSEAARVLGCSVATVGNRARSAKFPEYEFV